MTKQLLRVLERDKTENVIELILFPKSLKQACGNLEILQLNGD
jgi:hypothetical protein